MIYWLRLFGLIFIFVCIVAVVGSLLPRSYDFEVAQTVQATPEEVYQRIDTFPDWQGWSQWSAESENVLLLKYSDDGKTLDWTDNRGKGTMKIVETEANQRVKVTSNYGDFPEMVSTLEISNDAGVTIIVWRSVGRLPSGPFYGYFSPFFPNGMRAQYGESLRKLKLQCEGELP